MDLNDMIKYYYSSAKIRQENSKNVINREVTSAKDDIQARDLRTLNVLGRPCISKDYFGRGSWVKAIKTACSAIRTKMTNLVKSGSSYIETMNTPTYGMHNKQSEPSDYRPYFSSEIVKMFR